MNVLLILIIYQLSGQPMTATAPMADLPSCIAKASEFLSQDPDTFDAKALSAGCVVEKKGAKL